MHGLIFETSIWLLAGSTRFLISQVPAGHPAKIESQTLNLTKRSSRIHEIQLWDRFIVSNRTTFTPTGSWTIGRGGLLEPLRNKSYDARSRNSKIFRCAWQPTPAAHECLALHRQARTRETTNAYIQKVSDLKNQIANCPPMSSTIWKLKLLNAQPLTSTIWKLKLLNTQLNNLKTQIVENAKPLFFQGVASHG